MPAGLDGLIFKTGNFESTAVSSKSDGAGCLMESMGVWVLALLPSVTLSHSVVGRHTLIEALSHLGLASFHHLLKGLVLCYPGCLTPQLDDSYSVLGLVSLRS